jgi:hypothetical protein
MKTPFKHVGSVSHGTLRPEDLVPTFAILLYKLDPEHFPERHPVDLEEEVEWLIDRLNDYAPPYFYFGAHPGDGSDFGFWFDEESFEQAVADGEIVKLAGLPDFERIRDDYGEWNGVFYVAVISDHGNISLYDLDGEELWAIV